jgi:hypothetical protein
LTSRLEYHRPWSGQRPMVGGSDQSAFDRRKRAAGRVTFRGSRIQDLTILQNSGLISSLWH